MEQKRFLTADEVFQLFGVDAEALDKLVESGSVKALADLGTFKYRSEDFANLVKEGKLSPRTSGELFQADDKGDIPFLKLKEDDRGLKFDEDVSFIELDEEALSEQAATASKTPIVPEKWFDDSDGSAEVVLSDSDLSTKPGDATDVEINARPVAAEIPESDSDVQVYGADAAIDYDEPDVAPSASDSDVRLEGPVTSASAASMRAQKKPDSDSDVRLTKPMGGAPQSDSDVTIAPKKAVESTLAQTEARKPDSNVQLASPVSPSAANLNRPAATADVKDSDLVVVNKAGSDSDVRLSDSDSDVRLTMPDSDPTHHDDSGIRLEPADSGIALEPVGSARPDDSGITLEPVSNDSGISLEPVSADSGITLEPVSADSGISLEPAGSDSGISMEAPPDSGITLQAHKTDSDIRFESADSGISLDSAGDSGISLDAPDSGIMLVDSSSDSGIMLSTGDSGISLVDEGADPSKTLADVEVPRSGQIGNLTQTLDVSGEHAPSSSFDVSLAESDHTVEMTFDDSSEEDLDAAVLKAGKPKGAGSKSSQLSDSFALGDSLEVDELDISEDLESAPESEYSGEFAEAEPEEVLEASDDDFSTGESSVADVDEMSDEDELAPARKVRTGPREPAWGMAAVIPIICASVLMLVSVTVLWGGIETMWSGKEASGPAGMLISTLGGLI